ncbi:hypothetical protein BH10PSE3_BH10PSE3_28710 [soil metagenome]
MQVPDESGKGAPKGATKYILETLRLSFEESAKYQVRQLDLIISLVGRSFIPIFIAATFVYGVDAISPKFVAYLKEFAYGFGDFIKTNAVETAAALVLITSLLGTAAVLFASQIQLRKRYRAIRAEALASKRTSTQKDETPPPAREAKPAVAQRARQANSPKLKAEISSSAPTLRMMPSPNSSSFIQFIKNSSFRRDNSPSSYLDIYSHFKRRMSLEEDRLKRNSGLNLFWGILFAVFAMIFLLVTIFYRSTYPILSTQDFVAIYGPRATLAIILELISFFFLRLYNATEQEIKHHKNEVTNMESKFAAALIAMEAPTAPLKAQIVKGFMESERNFLLRKNEKTVASEMSNNYNDFLETLSIVSGVRKKSRTKRPGLPDS